MLIKNIFFGLSVLILSFSGLSEEPIVEKSLDAKTSEEKIVKAPKNGVKNKHKNKKKALPVTSDKVANPAVPCDSKEDLLKKLEEKKKNDEEKGKGFSLQGGNTGCKI